MLFSICIVVVTLLYFYLWRPYRNKDTEKFQLIPGPRSTSPDGVLEDVMKAGSMHHYLTKLHSQYGPLVYFRLMGTDCVSTYTPESYKEQLRIFDKPEVSMQFLTPVFGTRFIQVVNREEAKRRREVYDQFLNTDFINSYVPSIIKIADELVTQLRSLPPGEHISVYDTMFNLTCKAIGINLFGDYFRSDEHIDGFRKLYEQFWPLLEANFTQSCPLPPEGSAERKHFDSVCRQVTETAENIKISRASAQDRKLIDLIMETGEDDISINGDILTYLVGGFHSTSIALTWSIYEVARRPDIQAKLYEEIDDVFDGYLSVSDAMIDKLRYLRRVMDETLRMRFVAPVATRAAEVNTKICGYDIPMGTQIFQALSVTLMDDKLWPNPERFDPDRFLQENSKQRKPLTFCPFGFAGKRMCPGKTFSYIESLIYLATLYRNFELKLVNENSVDITYGLLTRPSEDISITVSERKL